METEKVNTGETAPDKDFLDRVNEIAEELRDMAQKDRKNRFVLLIAGDESMVIRMLQGQSDPLTNITGRSLATDEEGRDVMFKTFARWLSVIDPHVALNITKVLYKTVETAIKEEVSRPKAEA